MEDITAFCGLDCAKCEAYNATLSKDEEMKKLIAKKWSQLNGVEITPDMIHCLGCKGLGCKTPFCENICQIQKCAISKKVQSCADCSLYLGCSKLAMITGSNMQARWNLEKRKKRKEQKK